MGQAAVHRGLPERERWLHELSPECGGASLLDRPSYPVGVALGLTHSVALPPGERWPSCQKHSDQSAEKGTRADQGQRRLLEEQPSLQDGERERR